MIQEKILKQQIKQSINDKKSKAKRIETLFNKYSKWFRAEYETAEFEEPVMFLERRSGDVEFYEKATSGLFDFKHSDGEERFIILTPNKQKKYGFGKKMFKGYYCHEDYPLPLPQDPLITAEQVNIIVEKTLNDVRDWKAKDKIAMGKMTKSVLIGLAIVIGVGAMGYMMIKNTSSAPQVIQVVRDTAVTVGGNITPTILK